jgi:predicted HNH restriction endonuclease
MHGGKCENCGSTDSLAIHHLDNNGRRAENEGRKPNNSADNLVVLCAKCHADYHIRGVELHLQRA